ncbi:MAG: DUF1232 domain-containing protein [Gemmatimonadota bacterium]|nr:MAG: DUF1232 domain-containing protein [Gemmatimonadota bacterium]
MRDFTQVVRENVGEYRGWFISAVKWTPIFAATLMALSQDPRLQPRHRTLVNAALAYFVTSDDAVPEGEYGPYGYLDDNLVSAYVLERIAREIGWRVIEESWNGELAARDVARETLDRENELLGHLGQEALQKAGVLEEGGRQVGDVGEVTPPVGLA